MKAPILETIVVTKSIDEYPDLSYLQQDYFADHYTGEEAYMNVSKELNEKYKAEDARKLRNYGETWLSLNIQATGYAELVRNNQTFTTELGDSICGVESTDEDGINTYQNEFIYNILVECRKNKIKIAPNLKLIVKDKF